MNDGVDMCELWRKLYENPKDEGALNLAKKFGLLEFARHMDNCDICQRMVGLSETKIDIYYLIKTIKPLIELFREFDNVSDEEINMLFSELINEFGDEIELVHFNGRVYLKEDI